MNKPFGSFDAESWIDTHPHPADAPAPRQLPASFLIGKRVFDLALVMVMLPVTGMIALILLMLNPIWNRGPLFFSQIRMGRNGVPFRAWKFRTMRCAPEISRGPNDPVEVDRITPLGRFLRRTRLDEFPQFVNVMLGEMSFIGPRPDYWDHAVHYVKTVPGYQQRYQVRPGITGLAQVDGGYAEGVDATVVKTRHDLRYIETAGFATDWYVFWRTVRVVLSGQGAR